jgi:hypothetical protein
MWWNLYFSQAWIEVLSSQGTGRMGTHNSHHNTKLRLNSRFTLWIIQSFQQLFQVQIASLGHRPSFGMGSFIPIVDPLNLVIDSTILVHLQCNTHD